MDRSASHSLLRLGPEPKAAGPSRSRRVSRPRMFGLAVCRLRSAESGPLPCSGRLMTPAAGWRGASMSIHHMYQHRRSLARRSRGTMAQLSVRFVVRPVVRLVVARPMVRLEARPVYHRRSPAAPDPYCVPAGPSMVLEETVKDMSSQPGLSRRGPRCAWTRIPLRLDSDSGHRRRVPAREAPRLPANGCPPSPRLRVCWPPSKGELYNLIRRQLPR